VSAAPAGARHDETRDVDPAQVGYRDAAAAWAAGPMLAYGPLARHLVARSPVPLDGAVVLDAGAGTGAAGAVLRELGAFVVAIDLQPEMLLMGRSVGGSAAVADVSVLPLRSGAVDVAVAAFVLNHVADPTCTLRELRRACVADGVVLASTFSGQRASAKNVVDDVARRYGWEPPRWYAAIQARAAQIGTCDAFAAASRRAGLVHVEVDEMPIDVGLDDPSALAAYRLGMPQFNELLHQLAPDRRQQLHDDAVEQIRRTGGAFRPVVIELIARAG